jgi:hypothetical protein
MGREYMCNNEMRTITHYSGKREADGSVQGEKSKGAKEREKNGHGAMLLITYYEYDTACRRYRMRRIQFRTGPAGRVDWNKARGVPWVGKYDDGRTVVIWTL